jgi:hypothetical protein
LHRFASTAGEYPPFWHIVITLMGDLTIVFLVTEGRYLLLARSYKREDELREILCNPAVITPLP